MGHIPHGPLRRTINVHWGITAFLANITLSVGNTGRGSTLTQKVTAITFDGTPTQDVPISDWISDGHAEIIGSYPDQFSPPTGYDAYNEYLLGYEASANANAFASKLSGNSFGSGTEAIINFTPASIGSGSFDFGQYQGADHSENTANMLALDITPPSTPLIFANGTNILGGIAFSSDLILNGNVLAWPMTGPHYSYLGMSPEVHPEISAGSYSDGSTDYQLGAWYFSPGDGTLDGLLANGANAGSVSIDLSTVSVTYQSKTYLAQGIAIPTLAHATSFAVLCK